MKTKKDNIKYEIKKVVYARSMKEALRIEKDTEPYLIECSAECSVQEDGCNNRPMGFVAK